MQTYIANGITINFACSFIGICDSVYNSQSLAFWSYILDSSNKYLICLNQPY
jgi:hypothetical protein